MKKKFPLNSSFINLSPPLSSHIVGELHLENHHYWIINLEDSFDENDLETPVNSQSSTISDSNCLEISRLIIEGQCYGIIEADLANSSTAEEIATLLSSRELQIATLVALGHANKQIAHQLHLSEWTVSTYLRRIFAKLGVDSRAAMVYRCASLIQRLNGLTTHPVLS
jgi:DNA-binding CsgD family transcriptional regulator